MSKKISEMTPATQLNGDDIVPIVDTGKNNKTVTGNQIKSFATNELNDKLIGVRKHDTGSNNISISGTFSSIGDWIKNNYVTSYWVYARVNPTDNTGAFGSSSFSIMANLSSTNYGWCYLMSDNPNQSVIIFGQLTGGVWHWYKPTLTTIS